VGRGLPVEEHADPGKSQERGKDAQVYREHREPREVEAAKASKTSSNQEKRKEIVRTDQDVRQWGHVKMKWGAPEEDEIKKNKRERPQANFRYKTGIK